MKYVIKRNGNRVKFDKQKIINAITKTGLDDDTLKEKIASEVEKSGDEITVSEIHNLVEKKLMSSSHKESAAEYVRYHQRKDWIHENEKTNDSILKLIEYKNSYINDENSNKNPSIASTQRDYMAGEVSKELSERLLLPPDIVKAHNDGIIHFHDEDYFAQHIFNCCLINLEDMLQNGTVINGTLVEKPHSFSTACNIATQIMAQVASNQYGGQTESLSHLAPFVDISRKKIKETVDEEWKNIILNCKTKEEEDSVKKHISSIVESRLHDEIKRGVQMIQYQINTLMTTNGQTPFVSICMYLDEVPEGRTRDDLAMIIEEVIKQRYQGTKNEKGVWITPSFPKLLYVLEEDNIKENSKYYYLTKLAAKCTAKRMVPDYISEKKMKEFKIDKNGNGQCYPCMGCRSFLTPYIDKNGKPKYYGRFNQGVVTINLPDVALSAIDCCRNTTKDKYNEFWNIFDKRLELCHKALQIRHHRLEGTVSDISPIHWQYGALARLEKGEKIDKLLHGGYSTISLGYAGLYECVLAMTGKSHTDESSKPFALEIMKHMNDMCNKWKAEENIDYSLYGTPIESTTYKFAQCLHNRFGNDWDCLTGKNYITNSYHVVVTEKIDAFTKLKFESEFQKLSPGGAISYIEASNLTNNIDAVLNIIKFIYENIMYAEINTKSDYCQCCGYDGEIQIVKDEKSNKLIWKCPNCGNTDQHKMNVARRTCGYIGSNFWNQGRTEEIMDRYVHLGGND